MKQNVKAKMIFNMKQNQYKKETKSVLYRHKFKTEAYSLLY